MTRYSVTNLARLSRPGSKTCYLGFFASNARYDKFVDHVPRYAFEWDGVGWLVLFSLLTHSIHFMPLISPLNFTMSAGR